MQKIFLIPVFVLISSSLSCQKPAETSDDGQEPPASQTMDPGQNKSSASMKEIQITPVEHFSEPEGGLNSHAGMIARSHFSFLRDTYVILDEEHIGTLPVYPRFTKTPSGDFLMFYHQGNSFTMAGNECFYLRSLDAIHWTYEKKLFVANHVTDQFGTGNIRMFAGAFPVSLPGGDVLVIASTRMCNNYHNTHNDNGFAIRRSSDSGRTWIMDGFINVGTNWEPMVVVLPSGKIQVYFTDGNHLNPDVLSGVTNGSGTAMIESVDNGKTWTPPGQEHHHVIRTARVANEAGTLYTDQMPAVVKLNGTSRMMAALESNRSQTSTADYWISFAYSDDKGEWGEPDGRGECPKDRNNYVFHGAAPYLSTFPSGETLLTYNDKGNFLMSVGDEKGKGFPEGQQVFAGLSDKRSGKGYWGSTYRMDAHRVIASVGGSNRIIQVGQYYLNHAIRASRIRPVIDGLSKEWNSNHEALLLTAGGVESCSKASLRASSDADSVYFVVERADKILANNKYSDIYLADPDETRISAFSRQIRVSKDGLVSCDRFISGGWKSVKAGVRAVAGFKNGVGYVVEIAIPRAQLPIKNGELLLNFALSGMNSDSVAPVGESTETWVPLLGL